MIKLLFASAVVAIILADCKTMEQRVEDRSRMVCFQAGYGETSPRHDECMRTVLPIGTELERKQRMQSIEEGAALIGAGLHPDGVTCVDTGTIINCHR